MDIDRLIDEIYKAYPMCKVKIVPCNDVPNMICITIGFYHHGDCLEFLHYVDADVRDRSYYDATTALTGLTTSPQQAVVEPRLRIRKLTPLECFRLMGFDDDDLYKAEKVNSNTQLYKQAGNSIVVDVLEALFNMIFDKNGNILV